MAYFPLTLLTLFTTFISKLLRRWRSPDKSFTDTIIPETHANTSTPITHADTVRPESHADAIALETYADKPIPETGRFLGAGKSGVVHELDAGRVLKEYHDPDACAIEHTVYKRLGSHPNIAKLLEIRKDGSIVLERGTPVRSICRGPSSNEIPIERKVCWLRQAAEGYRYLHDQNIVHGDVGTHNWVLTEQDCVKLIDMEGCSIDGGVAGSMYEWFSYRRSVPSVSPVTDIFAFGCAMYELSTGRPPYHELEKADEPCRRVEDLYAAQQFPDVANLHLGFLIQKCWDGRIGTMNEMITELEALPSNSRNAWPLSKL